MSFWPGTNTLSGGATFVARRWWWADIVLCSYVIVYDRERERERERELWELKGNGN